MCAEPKPEQAIAHASQYIPSGKPSWDHLAKCERLLRAGAGRVLEKARWTYRRFLSHGAGEGKIFAPRWTRVTEYGAARQRRPYHLTGDLARFLPAGSIRSARWYAGGDPAMAGQAQYPLPIALSQSKGGCFRRWRGVLFVRCWGCGGDRGRLLGHPSRRRIRDSRYACWRG